MTDDLWRDGQGRSVFQYERVDRMELEFNNTCFLYCGGCGRTFNEKIEKAGKRIIKLEDVKWMFPPHFCKQLHWFLSCGNYGEPTAHPDCLEILRWFRSNGTKNVSFSSNGSSRDPDFWREAAHIINGKGSRGNIKNYYGGRVTFSIDGLADTNHLYRIGANWDKLMANVEAFISAGGRARWQMILMSHNEHQLQDAKALAKKLGFSEFIEKLSFRFIPVRMSQKHAEKLAQEAEFQMLKEKDENDRKRMLDPKTGLWNPEMGRVFQSDDILTGKHSRVEKVGGLVESPINISQDPRMQHPDRKMLAAQRMTKNTNLDPYKKQHNIICQNRTQPRIYVSFDGKVWPCNWLGGIEYYEDSRKSHWPIQSMVHHNIPLDFNSLYNYKDHPDPVKAILESPWYDHLLEEDWNNKNDPSGSLQPHKCKQMCHTEIGTGLFEKMRRNEQNLVTGEYSDVNKIHGLTPPQGGTGHGPGAVYEVKTETQKKVQDVVADENYDSDTRVDEKYTRKYKYYKEVEPGKFVVSSTDEQKFDEE